MKFEEELDKTKQKIYYFFGGGEFVWVLDANNEKEALAEFLKEHSSKDYDLVVEYNKKDSDYMIYKNFNQLKKTKHLRHRR